MRLRYKNPDVGVQFIASMIFKPTELSGAFIVCPEPIKDERGFFTYLFDANETTEFGLSAKLAQVKLSFNYYRGTLRGMHYQDAPSTETKLVRCTRGAIIDVIVDVRPDSPTYLKHISVELTADNREALYVPALFAHGYQTLVDHTEVVYQVDEFYAPHCERGLRYDDPELNIRWPLPVSQMSPRDREWPLIKEGR